MSLSLTLRVWSTASPKKEEDTILSRRSGGSHLAVSESNCLIQSKINLLISVYSGLCAFLLWWRKTWHNRRDSASVYASPNWHWSQAAYLDEQVNFYLPSILVVSSLITPYRVDTFRNIGDFVRTYGTLCWNLAKVSYFFWASPLAPPPKLSTQAQKDEFIYYVFNLLNVLLTHQILT